MAIIRTAITELWGLFVDDGALALLTLALIGMIVAAIKLLGVSPLIGGAALLVGYLVILGESVLRHSRK